jgi:hypothetical protein
VIRRSEATTEVSRVEASAWGTRGKEFSFDYRGKLTALRGGTGVSLAAGEDRP